MKEDGLQSIRSSSRGRTRERGFALISALILSVLYFGLMELMLIDAQRALAEAQRFRARVVASTLAESAAELAAEQIVTQTPSAITETTAQGTLQGTGRKIDNDFTLTGVGVSTGVATSTAMVTVQGRVTGTQISIDSTEHR
jgi:Tfp pilus assembly protein PilX